jgi:hypothetical protein
MKPILSPAASASRVEGENEWPRITEARENIVVVVDIFSTVGRLRIKTMREFDGFPRAAANDY